MRSPVPEPNNTNRVRYFKDCPKPLTFFPRNIIIIKRTKFACLAQPVEHAAVNRSVGGSSPSTGAIKAPHSEVFFSLLCFGTRTPRAMRAFGKAETTLRTPHWTRSAQRATIAIPSLRSLRGFESLNRRHLKETAFAVSFFFTVFPRTPRAVRAFGFIWGEGIASPLGCRGDAPVLIKERFFEHHTVCRISKLKQAERV